MTRKVIFSVIAGATLISIGCRDFNTPRDLRCKPKPDNPGLTIEEQQRNGRARYPLPDDDFRVGPKTGVGAVDPSR